MHPIAVNERATNAYYGFDSKRNVGWIKLGTKDKDLAPRVENSIHGEAHAEEKLIAYAAGMVKDLKMAPDADGDQLRVKELYTERRPCRQKENSGDEARLKRHEGSCKAYLHKTLHEQVPVFYSVKGPEPHTELRHKAWAEHHKNQQLRQVDEAYTAKYNSVKSPDVKRPPGLWELYEKHVKAIKALQPANWGDERECSNCRDEVTKASRKALAELQAWPSVPTPASSGPPGLPPAAPGLVPAPAAPGHMPAPAAPGHVPAPTAPGLVPAPAALTSAAPAPAPALAPAPVPAPPGLPGPEKRGHPGGSGDPATKRPLVGSSLPAAPGGPVVQPPPRP
ncbi:hypothetical protein [Jatrophihabitans sp.]|uniref:hypothetical protein n=1 Tax=Jatrophihabitans sp. TaxID=1932789 RepID=UPI002C26C8EC|nr:hypothetical protein [Jatrophihabitans sp.]